MDAAATLIGIPPPSQASGQAHSNGCFTLPASEMVWDHNVPQGSVMKPYFLNDVSVHWQEWLEQEWDKWSHYSLTNDQEPATNTGIFELAPSHAWNGAAQPAVPPPLLPRPS
jgi:hypothetical protein